MKNELFDRVNNLAQIIYDKKGFNILALDLRDLSSTTDCVVIAEANVNRHSKAIIDSLKENFDEKPYRIEGAEEGDWIVVDYLDIIVHIFLPNVRQKYNIERLWEAAKIIDLQLATSKHSASL